MKLSFWINVSSVFVVFLLHVTIGDVLKYYEKYKNIIRPSEAVQEPLNNAPSPGQIQYSVANLSHNFKSSTKFQARGMAQLYWLTERFIQFIAKDQAFPERKYYNGFYSSDVSASPSISPKIPLIAHLSWKSKMGDGYR